MTERDDMAPLVAELTIAGGEVHGTEVKCPFHQDGKPSGSIHHDKDGVWRFTCHSCGASGDVYDISARRQNIPLAEVLPKSGRPAPVESVASQEEKASFAELIEIKEYFGDEYQAMYLYQDPGTQRNDLVVVRIWKDEKKSFRQFHPVEGGYAWGAPEKPWPIYNRAALETVDRVLVVEGEKCVKACASINIPATTAPCGAGKAPYADWGPLAGKRVVLWPDKDDKGIAHMQDVLRALESVTPAVRVTWLDPDDVALDEKGDVADFIGMGGSREDVEYIMDAASPTGPYQDVARLMNSTVDGTRTAIVWPWTRIGRLTQALLPGTLSVLCGDPGAAKTWWILQAVASWYDLGIPCALFVMEDDRAAHLQRILAQRIGKADLLDVEWVRMNGLAATRYHEANSDWLDGFGRIVTDAPETKTSLSDVNDWIEARAAAGARVIVVDPITAASSGKEKPWEAYDNFVMQAKVSARRHQASVLITTHPVKGNLRPSLDGMAGGAALQRFAHSVFWLVNAEKGKDYEIRGDSGKYKTTLDKVIRIEKARLGPGQGILVGFDFDRKTLRFLQKGTVSPDA